MTVGAKWLWSVLVIAVPVSLVTFGCGGSRTNSEGGNAGDGAGQAAQVVHEQAPDSVAAAINAYLGTSADTTIATLLGSINKNNEYLRGVIKDLQCDVWKLKHPGETPQNGCPPGGGSESPTVVPKYPQ